MLPGDERCKLGARHEWGPLPSRRADVCRVLQPRHVRFRHTGVPLDACSMGGLARFRGADRKCVPMPANNPIEHKLALDTQLVDVYLTGLQAEIEAKLRRVAKFREEMRKIDAVGGKTDRMARRRAARALIRQAQTMLETNLVVRGMLEDLLEAAKAVLRDVE